MDSEDRKRFKAGARKLIADHRSFYLLNGILMVALFILGDWVTKTYALDVEPSMRDELMGTVLYLAAGMLNAGVSITMIDIDRGKADFDKPVERSFALFDKARYFWGWIGISIISTILVVLWSLLLIVPGIIKAISYSQAFYIYRDAVDRGEDIRLIDAITRSRELMNGEKGFMFLMMLSFLLWFFVGAITYGVANLFILPYFWQTQAKFYNQLLLKQKEQESAAGFRP